MSIHDVITLASVVQFEAGKEEDMRMISQVFLNRMDIGMRLESSVTVCYALYEYDSWKDCENYDNQTLDSRYNTYLYSGLPIGPITNPSKLAILSTIQPKDNDYLFFLADVYGDGTVYYAKTYAEHQANIKANIGVEKTYTKVKTDETKIDAEAENIMKTDVTKQKPSSIKDLFNSIN